MSWEELIKHDYHSGDDAIYAGLSLSTWRTKYPNLARHTTRKHPTYENKTEAVNDGKEVIQGEDSIIAFAVWENGGKFKLFFRDTKPHETSDEALRRIREGANKTSKPTDLHFWIPEIKTEPEQSTFLQQTSMHRYFTRSRPRSITSV